MPPQPGCHSPFFSHCDCQGWASQYSLEITHFLLMVSDCCSITLKVEEDGLVDCYFKMAGGSTTARLVLPGPSTSHEIRIPAFTKRRILWFMSQVLGTPLLKDGASPSLPIAANQFGDKIVCLQTEMTMKKTRCLGLIGDYTTQLYGDYKKPLQGSLLNNQYNGKHEGFSVAQMTIKNTASEDASFPIGHEDCVHCHLSLAYNLMKPIW